MGSEVAASQEVTALPPHVGPSRFPAARLVIPMIFFTEPSDAHPVWALPKIVSGPNAGPIAHSITPTEAELHREAALILRDAGALDT